MKFTGPLITVIILISLFIGTLRVISALVAPGGYKSVQRGWRYSIIQRTELDLLASKIIVTTKINDNSFNGYLYNAWLEDKVDPEQLDSIKKVHVDSMRVKLKDLIEFEKQIK